MSNDTDGLVLLNENQNASCSRIELKENRICISKVENAFNKYEKAKLRYETRKASRSSEAPDYDTMWRLPKWILAYVNNKTNNRENRKKEESKTLLISSIKRYMEASSDFLDTDTLASFDKRNEINKIIDNLAEIAKKYETIIGEVSETRKSIVFKLINYFEKEVADNASIDIEEYVLKYTQLLSISDSPECITKILGIFNDPKKSILPPVVIDKCIEKKCLNFENQQTICNGISNSVEFLESIIDSDDDENDEMKKQKAKDYREIYLNFMLYHIASADSLFNQEFKDKFIELLGPRVPSEDILRKIRK